MESWRERWPSKFLRRFCFNGFGKQKRFFVEIKLNEQNY